MKTTPRILTSLTAAVLLLYGATPAAAVSFDFYKLGNGGGDFLPTDGVPATGGDLASSDVDNGVFNGDLTFLAGGITAVATASYLGNEVAVVQDRQAGWTAALGAGLGVYSVNPVLNSDDNITVGEALTITFDRLVALTTIGLRAEGHNFTGWTPGATFLLDGVNTLLPLNVGSIGVNLIGTSFSFAYGGNTPDQFYLASLDARAVPDGGLTALFLALSMTALAGIRTRLHRA